jgi:hypothetical protein
MRERINHFSNYWRVVLGRNKEALLILNEQYTYDALSNPTASLKPQALQSSNSYIHIFVSDLYIPTIGLPLLQQEIGGWNMGIYCIKRSQIHECGNWGRRPLSLFSGST